MQMVMMESEFSQRVEIVDYETVARDYLVERALEAGEPWLDQEALEDTVREVMYLDDDLRRYVFDFLRDRTKVHTSLGCEVASVQELVFGGGFSPVTAALFVQWYRDNPRSAAAFLLQNDSLRDIPEGIDSVE